MILLKVFTLRRNGFNQSLAVGESITFKNDKYVIIEIGSLKARVYKEPRVEMTAVCQKVGVNSEFDLYERHFTFKDRCNTVKEMIPEIYNAGEFIGNQGKKEDLVMRIIGIKKMYYEHVDLIIEYAAELIKPWSAQEIEQALKEERLSGFKVIKGGN